MATKISTPSSKIPSVVVGIGASAGGLIAMRKLLGKLGKNQEAAFVLVQHLDDSGGHLAHEVLSRLTQLPVVEVQDGKRIQTGVVYHAPPHVAVSIKGGVFKTEKVAKRTERFSVIDVFFKSLAKSQGERAIAIVLSGEGSDGALGLKAVADSGGVTLAQIPESAEFPSMPQNAIATGAVDEVLLPDKMAERVESFASSMKELLKKKSSTIQEQIASALNEICDILYRSTRHDFKHYKTSTLVRRIQRRMQVLQVSDVEAYLDKLRHESKETDSLFKELLINVTCFFRDPEAFEKLAEGVLKPALKARKPEQKYRIWVAGCSTGEEVYTLAILVREITSKLKNPPEVQIIATDIDEQALSVARKGSYPATIVEHVSPARLKKYFTKKSGRYLVNRELREIVLFSSHNLINDPPFSQLDLISCRNVLIYLGQHLQKKLIPVFHYALRPGGCLFLGTSEPLASHKELFKSISAKHRIGQRKATAVRPPGFSTSLSNSFVVQQMETAKNHETDLHMVSQRILLDEFSPKYAVVNDDCQIVYASSGLENYMEIADGVFHNNLTKLVKTSLRVGLRSAFTAAKKQKRKVTHQDSTVRRGDAFVKVRVVVQPMPNLGDESELYFVAFQDNGLVRGKVAKKGVIEHAYSNAEIVNQLESELSTLREDLDRTVQDLEASNEELKSSNEELLSMNEELQSANEELEASKEEIQNANEALYRSNSDLENLLGSTEIATLFLDDNFCIQNFTPKISTIYSITRNDVGRSISDFTSRANSMPSLPAVEDVRRLGVKEDDIDLVDGRHILRRVTPYRTAEGTYSGIVVTFIDVTHLRIVESLRKESEKRFEIMADTAPVLIWLSGKDGKRTWFNKGWVEFTGLSIEQSIDPGWQTLVHPEDRSRYLEVYNSHFETRTPFHIEYRLMHQPSGQYRWISARGVPRVTPDGEFQGYVGACLDIDDQRNARELLRESRQRFQTLTEVIPQLVWTCFPNGECDYLSKQWVDYTGIAEKDQLGLTWLHRVIHPEDRQRTLDHWMGAIEGKHHYDIEYRIKRHDGEYRWFQARGTPIRNSDGRIVRWFGTCTDIHDLKLAQERISSSEKRLEMMIRTSPSFMCLLSGDDFVFEQANEHYLKLVGHRDILGKTLREALPEIENQGFISLLERVRKTGEPYVGTEVEVMLQRVPNGPLEKRYVDFVYQPSEILEGRTIGVFVHGVDVTEKVETRVAIENERQNFRNLFKQSPEMVCILNGPEHLFEFVNEAHVKVLGFDATGKTVREAQPESVEVHGILDNVYRTGETAFLNEIPVTVGNRLRYFNLTYAPRIDLVGQINGIMILGTEVTDEVVSRNSLMMQRRALELAIGNAPVSEVLSELALSVEMQAGGNLIASVLLIDSEGKRLLHGAAPSLPSEYNDVIHGIMIGDNVGSCGTAAFRKQQIIVSNIEQDPLWKDFKDLALRFGLKACWSIPILSSEGRLLGTFAFYSKTARTPTDREIAVVEVAAKTTALILERKVEMEERMARAQETQRLYHELEARSAQLEAMIENVPLGVTLAEAPSGRLVRSNRQVSKVWRQPQKLLESVEEYGEYVAFHPDGRQYEGNDWPLARAIRNGTTVIKEDTEVLLGDGTRGILRISAAPVRDSNGNIVGGVVLSEDVTEQKRAEAELKRAKIEADSANLAKTRFLANMSHEIRTPLSAIVGFSELLRSKMKSDPEANSFIDRISRNSTQLSRLIDELLDLSKIEADKLEIERAPINVDALLEDVYSAMVLRAAEKSLELSFTWSSPKPTILVTDPVRLSQIFINIVGNAVKFTEKGAVTVDLSFSGDHLQARISDTGIGLTVEQQRRIFEPFMQADASVTRKYGGTGLGLALSKRLARLLGGDLLLETSAPGVGTTFVLTIATELNNDSAQLIPGIESKVEEIGPDALKGKSILVVDDSSDNRVIVSMYLRSVGATIAEASNGEEGVKAALSGGFDLVLMDIQMPVADGYRAMGTLRQAGYDTPVIALTAHAFKEERDRCLASGFSGYITKPINRNSLVKSVCDLLISRRPNAANSFLVG